METDRQSVELETEFDEMMWNHLVETVTVYSHVWRTPLCCGKPMTLRKSKEGDIIAYCTPAAQAVGKAAMKTFLEVGEVTDCADTI